MKGLMLAFLLAAGCVSCGGSPVWRSGTISREDARDSVYQIHEDIHYHRVPVAKEDPTGAPDDADDEDGAPPKEETRSYIGTGWVEDRAAGRSYIMTAGHLCETRDTVTVRVPEIAKVLFGMDDYDIQIDSVDYSVVSRDGAELAGLRVILVDHDVDLCMLAAVGDLGEPLPVAGRDPTYGSDGYYIGAPNGLWGGGIAGIYRIEFGGRGRPFDNCQGEMEPICAHDELMFSGPFYGGASGSPVLVNGQVVATFNIAGVQFNSFGLGVPWDAMRTFIRRARHAVPEMRD